MHSGLMMSKSLHSRRRMQAGQRLWGATIAVWTALVLPVRSAGSEPLEPCRECWTPDCPNLKGYKPACPRNRIIPNPKPRKQKEVAPTEAGKVETLLAEGKCKEAASLLAKTASKPPRRYRDLAVCFAASGNLEEAVRFDEVYLVLAPNAVDVAQVRHEVELTRRALEQKRLASRASSRTLTGTNQNRPPERWLDVRTNPPGAALYLHDKLVGYTPIALHAPPLNLRSQDIVLVIRRAGFETVRVRVPSEKWTSNGTRENQAVDVTLTPAIAAPPSSEAARQPGAGQSQAAREATPEPAVVAVTALPPRVTLEVGAFVGIVIQDENTHWLGTPSPDRINVLSNGLLQPKQFGFLMGFRAGVGLPVARFWRFVPAIEMEASLSPTSAKSQFQNMNYWWGLVNLALNLPLLEDRLTPFVVAGAGLVRLSSDEPTPGGGGANGGDTAPSIDFGMGVKYQLLKDTPLQARFDLRYLVDDPRTSGGVHGTDDLQSQFGIAYVFGGARARH